MAFFHFFSLFLKKEIHRIFVFIISISFFFFFLMKYQNIKFLQQNINQSIWRSLFVGITVWTRLETVTLDFREHVANHQATRPLYAGRTSLKVFANSPENFFFFCSEFQIRSKILQYLIVLYYLISLICLLIPKLNWCGPSTSSGRLLLGWIVSKTKRL